jgi:hypothetical protein
MPYSHPTFCGATVRDIRSAIGWGGQKSSLNVSLVDDPANGDAFLPPLPGRPIFLTIPDSSYRFYGIMQSYRRDAAPEGWPTYSVSCTDPRDILEGTQIILSNYSGQSNFVYNLLNIYGYWENTLGFGGSGINESGMQWEKIRLGISNLTHAIPATIYGGPLAYKGYYYAVDLSEIPVAPNYYRVGGGYTSLLYMIQQVCDDSGVDFFIELENTSPILTIKIRTVNKRHAQNLGAVYNLIQQYTSSGECIRSSYGLEDHNETTSTFLIGGPVQEIYETESPYITPYWGDDEFGLPIIGSGSGFNHIMSLYIPEIAYITGDDHYDCSVVELCTTLSANDNTVWQQFMAVNKPTLSRAIGITGELGTINDLPGLNGFPPANANDLRNLKAAAMYLESKLVFDVKHANVDNVFREVKKYAEEFLGKQFLVRIPFELTKLIPETNEIVFSHEGVDSGYTIDALPPLGLNFFSESKFVTEDGRYRAIALFENTSLIDASKISGQQDNYFYDNTQGLYARIQVDVKPVFVDPITPALKISLSNAIEEIQLNPTGASPSFVNEFLHGNQNNNIVNQRKTPIKGVMPTGSYLKPPPLQPDRVAVPLKSNILCYGPWFASGVAGKTQFEQDTTLVPWNYGSYQIMDQAAIARVVNCLSNTQYVESGEISFVGLPLFNIGDALELNGPIVTDIDIQYGIDRIATSYRLKTYTPRFGVYNRDLDRRLQRSARTENDLKRNLRKALDVASKYVAGLQITTNRINYDNALKYQKNAIKQRSPHTLLLSSMETGSKDRSFFNMFELMEGVSAVRADIPEVYNANAGMSMDGLFRAIDSRFTTNGGGHYFPSFTTPSSSFSTGITSLLINPFDAGNDIEFIIRGQSPTTGAGLSGADHEYDMQNYLDGTYPTGGTRPVVLRGPLVVCGWGYDLKGNLVPGSNKLTKTSLWKAGPVDMLWDQYRGVWTSHDILMGTLNSPLASAGTTTMTIYAGSTNTGETITVKNFFGAGVSGGKRVMAGYCMHANSWYVIAADC